MKIAIDWVKEFISINLPTVELADKLTASGLEVEGFEEFETIKGGLKGLVVGEVLECSQHPNADKLSVTTVDVGTDDKIQVVCGAPNVAQGQKVIVATVGTLLYTSEGESFKIKKSKIRGELSQGMICAEDEIGLGESHDGIMVLDTTATIGTPASEYFKVGSEDVIEIGLTPNRADAASHFGVAREVQALTGAKVKLPSLDKFKEGTSSYTVAVEDQVACPRYAGIVIEGITISSSPEWLQNRLKSIGLAPINNVVDITNYVLHSLGQPLHAFDLTKIGGDKVIVRKAKENETIVTLDEVERKLTANDLVICDDQKPMCIAGVFGGIDSGVSDATTSIFLESAYFTPEVIRKTAQRNSLKTDASFRFERGTDVNMVITALKYATTLIEEIAGGKAISSITDIYPSPIESFKIEVAYKNINRLIGIDVPKDVVKGILSSLDIVIEAETEETLNLSVPSYRVDVQREADIIEEILRLYGFDKIEVKENLSADFLANFPAKDVDAIEWRTKETLSGLGFQEIITNSLTKPEYVAALDSIDNETTVKIENELSADLGVMRQTLLFSGLEVVARNINHKQKDLKIYEFGKVYNTTNGEYKEGKKLSLFVTGNTASESWLNNSKEAAFHDLASPVVAIIEKLGIKGYQQEVVEHPAFVKALKITFKKKEIGFLGTVKPQLNKLVGIKQLVLFADLDWDVLFNLSKPELLYKEVPKFPAVQRDLSIVINKSVTFEEIKKVAQQTERKILKEVNVFDTFEGEVLGENKKSYSVKFILQDENKTLTDKVIDKTMTKLIGRFEKELLATIRR